MTKELKTLKDLTIKEWSKDLLKAEAIKWVKEFSKKWEDMNGFTDFGGELSFWIKHFFNIIEEDLK